MVLPLCGSPFPPLFWQYLLLAVSHGTENPEKKKISQFKRLTWIIVLPYDQSAVKMQGGREKGLCLLKDVWSWIT